jgi:hypothetical protein
MPVDKFGRTDEKVVQHTPTVTSSIGLTMGQINSTFLRRDGGNAMTADLNLNKHRLINLSELTAADDAVINSMSTIHLNKRDDSNVVTGLSTCVRTVS